MHAVGFFHEQSRPDRDEHVTINLENVEKGMEDNFMKYALNEANMVGEYDMCSIMHYRVWDHGQPCTLDKLKSRNCTKCQCLESEKRGRMLTVLPKHNRFEKYCNINEIGERQNFTNEDIMKLNLLYDCDKEGMYILYKST